MILLAAGASEILDSLSDGGREGDERGTFGGDLGVCAGVLSAEFWRGTELAADAVFARVPRIGAAGFDDAGAVGKCLSRHGAGGGRACRAAQDYV